jgi:acetylornithine deacetylase/succinyl-diaminopimelate desuccinylase-like protein
MTHGQKAAKARKYLERHEDRLLNGLLDLVRIPSVSADPARADDVARCATWLADRMRRIGLEDVAVMPTSGHPVVEGRTPIRAGASTYLVYAHYDVQPPDPLDEWDGNPFEPRRVDDEIRGRGVSDDKAHIDIHLAAAEAYLATSGGPPVNVRFVFEGAEEISSRHFDEWLDRTELLDGVDGCVVSDTTFLGKEVPSLGTGVRGLVYFQIDVRTADADLHSGGYGGAAPNAAEALTTILASLKETDGRIAIPGFYDQVVEDAAFRKTIAELPWSETEWRSGARFSASAAPGERGYSILERLWLRPTLDINGLWGGYSGDGPKTIIPSQAHAKVSCRLVPDQDPDRVFAAIEAAISAASPEWADVKVTKVSGSRPARVDATGGLARAAMRALELAFHRRPVLQREGGSIPVVGMLAQRLSCPIVLLGFSAPDDNAHAPNERLPIWNYRGGLATVAEFWALVPTAGDP